MKQNILNSMQKLCIITGHYGSGKTTIAANLAVALAQNGEKVTIADMDFVNPYFRLADYAEMFSDLNINLIVPRFANSNVDIPALPPHLIQAIQNQDEGYLIIDVGGDDAGAISLGQLSSQIKQKEYDLCYVINYYRYLTQTPKEAVNTLKEIETASRLTVTKLIHNSNLGNDTALEDIQKKQSLAEQTSQLSNVPIWFTAVFNHIDSSQIMDAPITIFQKEL